MEKYTDYLEEKTWEAADEDYSKEALLEVVKAFRTFDAAMNEFLVQHGYEGKIDDVSQKEAFIKEAFKTAGICKIPRNIRQWFTEKKEIKRKTAFQICFAFGLDVKETDEFFRRVLLEKSFDCHIMEEAAYYFCIRNRRTYPEAIKILEASPAGEVPKVTESRMIFDGDILFTSTILKELNKFTEEEDLLTYFRKNVTKFGYNHAGATEAIQRIWKEIARKDGLADLEKIKIQQQEVKGSSVRSSWDIMMQMLGLEETDEGKKLLFEIPTDRSIKPVLEENNLLPEVAEKRFPNRQTIDKIIKGEHVDQESIRKTLILLYFYYFWTGRIFKKKDPVSGKEIIPENKAMISRKNLIVYQAEKNDDERFIGDLNKQLLDVGYPALYMGNPYDWIFLYCSRSVEPLVIFREFIHELYLENEDTIDELKKAKEQKRSHKSE